MEMPEMTDEVAEENNVVAAICCLYCSHSNGDISDCKCYKLGCKTNPTDVCKNHNHRG